jgi:3',5'-cyclic AMP phosphodiesterase CpdA
MVSRIRSALLLALLLPACPAPPGDSTSTTQASGSTTTSSSSGADSTSTATPTSSSSTTTTTTTATTSESSTGEPALAPLPPLADPVPLTTDTLRVPTHPRDEDKLRDPRIPADLAGYIADGYGEIELQPGEPVLPRTLDDSNPPAPGPAPKLLARFVHLADTQLSDDESPARLAAFDIAADGAFRPQEGHLCRMLNAAVRTVNRIHADTPVDFVLLGGDNTDNAQSNELGWFLGILDGAPQIHCDSADDNDIIPGPDNDPKDPFGPVALDVPWRWVTGNHDILRQGTWPLAKFASEPIGTSATGGTRDYSQPGSPIVIGTVIADPARAFVDEAEQLARLSQAGDGHGIDAGALALGRAFYTFDVDGGPLRVFVLSSAAATGSSTGLIRQADIDAIIEPTLQAAAAANKLVIVTSHHRSTSLKNGVEPDLGVGEEFADALTPDEWVDYLGTHDHVIMHLAAHSHTMHADPRLPLGGHAYWEVASPALADFPHELRLLEVWDQDNGSLTIRTVAFDFVADDDPIADEGRSIGVIDFTSSWEGDGRGLAPSDRNVELWIAKP